MYPADRVLIGIMPHPSDLTYAQDDGWYRIRASAREVKHGVNAEYMGFYFPKTGYPEDMRLGIYYYARCLGYELVQRVDLFPDQPDHKRAHRRYYKVQLGPLKRKEPPILNQRDWRRLAFVKTTWDRFTSAQCLEDLFSKDEQFVTRLRHELTQKGIPSRHNVTVEESGQLYDVDIMIPCKDGPVIFTREQAFKPVDADVLTGYLPHDLDRIRKAVTKRGGPLMLDLPL